MAVSWIESISLLSLIRRAGTSAEAKSEARLVGDSLETKSESL